MNEKEQIFVQLFKKNACNVSVTCHKMGIDRGTYYDWYNKPAKIGKDSKGNELKDEKGNIITIENDFKKAIDEARESLIDFTESALFKKISGVTTKTTKIKEALKKDGTIVKLREETTVVHEPDIAAIIFLLKTLGRKRGWRDTTDINLENNLGNEIALTLEQKEALRKLTPEEKKELIRIGKKIRDD